LQYINTVNNEEDIRTLQFRFEVLLNVWKIFNDKKIYGNLIVSLALFLSELE